MQRRQIIGIIWAAAGTASGMIGSGFHAPIPPLPHLNRWEPTVHTLIHFCYLLPATALLMSIIPPFRRWCGAAAAIFMPVLPYLLAAPATIRRFLRLGPRRFSADPDASGH